MTQCPNYIHVIDRLKFWDGGSLKSNQCFYDHLVTLVKPHIAQKGAGRNWSIAGVCAVTIVIISTISVLRHCRYYTTPREQRQILRILYMPPISAVVSLRSYRFFLEYLYYSSISESVAYGTITLGAFVKLFSEYASSIHNAYDRQRTIERWTFAQMQYIFVCIAAHIIREELGNSREPGGFISNFISLSIKCAIFVSASFALDRKLCFYGLMSGELVTKRPLCVVLMTFMMLGGPGTLHMVLLSGLMMWAYSASEYKRSNPMNIGRPFWDLINFCDLMFALYSHGHDLGALALYSGRKLVSLVSILYFIILGMLVPLLGGLFPTLLATLQFCFGAPPKVERLAAHSHPVERSYPLSTSSMAVSARNGKTPQGRSQLPSSHTPHLSPLSPHHQPQIAPMYHYIAFVRR